MVKTQNSIHCRKNEKSPLDGGTARGADRRANAALADKYAALHDA